MAQNETTWGEEAITAYLRRWRGYGAMWTSDIAHGIRKDTLGTRRILVKMERAGIVRRVAHGNPISWELVNCDI